MRQAKRYDKLMEWLAYLTYQPDFNSLI